MNDHKPSDARTDLRNALIEILGGDGFDDGADQRTLYSQDIWSRGENAAFIAAPDNIDTLSRLVAEADRRGVALNPRGGGMSYTNGYAPDRADVGIVDFKRMNRIVEINTDDMFVTVEAGCTWLNLYEALRSENVRTPFWGPLSGSLSTIGGSLSQNNAFFGCGQHGTTGDSVLSVTVVLADGSVVRTGTAGTSGGKPFFKHYGPDLTGLFCGDAGALGFKAEITLRLIPLPSFEDWASFEFQNRDACAAALAELTRTGKACEVFGFDPNLQRMRMQRSSLAADAKTLGNVVKQQGSLLKGLKEGARIAMAGRNFVDEAAFALHFVVEGGSAAGVREDISALKKICAALQGKEIENSIPKIIRANPFGPLRGIVGPNGERWTPVHGIVPVSEGAATWAEIDALFERMASTFAEHGVTTGFLVSNLGTTGFLIEPMFFWPETLDRIHEATVGADYLAKLTVFDANPEATAIVANARQAVIDIFSEHAAAHFQIGRTYPYKERRRPEAWALLEQIKAAIDPNGTINPGALGLDPVSEGDGR